MIESKPNLRDLFSEAKTDHPIMGYPVLAVGVKDNIFTIKLSGQMPDSGFDAAKSAICKAYSLDKIAFEFTETVSDSQKLRAELGKRYPSLSFGDDIVSLDVSADTVNIDIFFVKRINVGCRNPLSNEHVYFFRKVAVSSGYRRRTA